MIAFAGSSLLCLVALKHTAIDPAAFTSIRMLSGAIALDGRGRAEPDPKEIPKEILTPKKPRSLSENRRRLRVSPQHSELLYFQSDKVSLDAK
jgi:hypothetical protein